MAKGDMQVVGMSALHRMRVAASATRGYAGEPVRWAGSYTSGVASVNTVVVSDDGDGIIGTDHFVGIMNKDMRVNAAGTVVAHPMIVARPIPNATKIRARHKTSASADTESEVIGLLFDLFGIDLTSSAYTWDAAGADTLGFTCIDGNPTRATLDCTVDGRTLRADIS